MGKKIANFALIKMFHFCLMSFTHGSLNVNGPRDNEKGYLTFCTFSFEFKESSLSDTRCLIQNVVSSQCGDK